MAVKVADTIEPMGSFPAVAAQHTSVTIDGTPTNLQSAIDNGQIGKQDLVYVSIPNPSEFRKAPMLYYADKIIEYLEKDVHTKFFIELPYRLAKDYGGGPAVNGWSFRINIGDYNYVVISGIVDTISYSKNGSNYTFEFICYNPIEANENGTVDLKLKKVDPFYIKFTASKSDYSFDVDPSTVVYQKLKSSFNPDSLYAYSVDDLFNFIEKASIGGIYQISISLSGNISNNNYESIEKTTTNLSVNQYMLCTNVMPGISATFVALGGNVDGEDEFMAIDVSNWESISEPEMHLGWLRRANANAYNSVHYGFNDWTEVDDKWALLCNFYDYDVAQYNNCSYEVQLDMILGSDILEKITIESFDYGEQMEIDLSSFGSKIFKGFIISGHNNIDRSTIELLFDDGSTYKKFIDLAGIHDLRVTYYTNEYTYDYPEPPSVGDIVLPEVIIK